MQTMKYAPVKFLVDVTDNSQLYPTNTDQRLLSQFHESIDENAFSLLSISAFDTSREMSHFGLGLQAREEYAGPKTQNLDGLNANTVAKFVEADKSYFAATGQYLKIESGRRTVYRQAELYICWQLKQAGCNPADIPGASVHNYGFAIDIQNAREATVISAMSSNGWKRTVMPKEPWHWEATSAAGYADAKQKQAEMKAQGSISRSWQEQWGAARTKNDTRNRKIDDFNARLQVWQPEWDRLRIEVEQFQRDAEAYNQKSDQHNRDLGVFTQWVDRFNTEVTSLEQLRSRIEAMSDSPERNTLIVEYNQRTEVLASEKDRLDRAQADLLARKQSLDAEYQELQRRDQDLSQRYSRLNVEKESLLRLKEEIDRLDTEIEGHIQKAREILDEIASIVSPL
jgi:hypothetical protein